MPSITQTPTKVDVNTSVVQIAATFDGAKSAVELLDQLMFQNPVFVYQADNQGAQQVKDIQAAQAALEAGTAATYCARLRPGWAAIDIDLDPRDFADKDEYGGYMTADETVLIIISHLAKWCDDRDIIWWERDSGGGTGRAHFMAAPATLWKALRAEANRLRKVLGLSGKQLDWRRVIRPNGAPHRSGNHGQLKETVACEVIGALKDNEWAGQIKANAYARPGATRRPWPKPKTTRQRKTVYVLRRSTTRRSLGDEGLDALLERIQTEDHSPGVALDRSASELGFTAGLKKYGYSEDQAWAIISDPSNKGFERTRSKGKTWWQRYAWPVACPSISRRETSSQARPDAPSIDYTKFVLPAAKALRNCWAEIDTRRRYSLDRVLAIVAEIATTYGPAPRPLALRMIRDDTGLDLHTISACLKQLCSLGLLQHHDRLSPGKYLLENETDAYTYSLNLDAIFSATDNPTPVSKTPLPPHREGEKLNPPPCLPSPCAAHWMDLPKGALSYCLDLLLATQSPTGKTRSTKLAVQRIADALIKAGILTSATTLSHAPSKPSKRAIDLWNSVRNQTAEERWEFRRGTMNWSRYRKTKPAQSTRPSTTSQAKTRPGNRGPHRQERTPLRKHPQGTNQLMLNLPVTGSKRALDLPLLTQRQRK